MIDADQIKQQFRDAFPALAKDSAFLDVCFQSAIQTTLAEASMVCEEGNACQYLPLVLSGTARVFKLSATGREITLYRMHAGDSCILTASCIISETPFPALAETETQTSVILIPAHKVHQWLQEFEVYRAFVFSLVSRRLADVITLLDEVAFGRLDERLLNFLRSQADFRKQVGMTHQQIADELGSSREVITRLLHSLQDKGVLQLSRGSIRLLADN